MLTDDDFYYNNFNGQARTVVYKIPKPLLRARTLDIRCIPLRRTRASRANSGIQRAYIKRTQQHIYLYTRNLYLNCAHSGPKGWY